MTSSQPATATKANGAALAAFMAAGIGAFTLGVVVILNEGRVLTVPAVYPPAGGVSGRTTIAAIVWLVSWVLLHRRWSGRELGAGRCHAVTLILTALGVLLNLPPLWKLL